MRNYAYDGEDSIVVAGRNTSAYPEDTSQALYEISRDYDSAGAPISLSFRDLVSWMRVGERATHYMHTYPGKLLPQIAHFFIAAEDWLPKDATILDPFAGSGTVALEAVLSGKTAYYADANPLAQEITAAKLLQVDVPALRLSLGRLIDRFKICVSAPVPNVVNVEKWYRPEVRDALSRLIHSINCEEDPSLRLVMRVTFSAVAKKASRANPRFSVPVIDKNSTGSYDVLGGFISQIDANIQRYQASRDSQPHAPRSHSVGVDARNLVAPYSFLGNKSEDQLADQSVDAIITSPPYLSAQKYVRASSLSLGWLGYTESTRLKEFENESIGREHYRTANVRDLPETLLPSVNSITKRIFEENRLRAVICANYINEMNLAVLEMYRVLKQGGKLVLVIGNNTVCGIPFDNASYLSDLAKSVGFIERLRIVDQIKSRALTMSRKGGHAPIRHEHIMVFEK